MNKVLDITASRLASRPEVQNAAKVAIGAATQSVLAPAAGGFLTELGVTGLGTTLTSLGGGTAVATASAAIGTFFAPVAVGAVAVYGLGWLYSKLSKK